MQMLIMNKYICDQRISALEYSKITLTNSGNPKCRLYTIKCQYSIPTPILPNPYKVWYSSAPKIGSLSFI